MEDVRTINDAFECGFRYIDPKGTFSWNGHKALCSHSKTKNMSCEDFGWYTKKGNNFPDKCPLINPFK